MTSDTIVRQAARAALASEHPVRVVDDGKLVGIVDDDAILRVVVAEEDATHDDHPRPTGAERRRRAPPPAPRARAAAALGLGAGRRRRLDRGLGVHQGPGHPRPARAASTPTCTRPLTDFRDAVLASRDTNPIVQVTYNHRRVVRHGRRLASADDLDPRLPAAGAADRLARRRSPSRPGSACAVAGWRIAAPGRRVVRLPSGSSATGPTRWTC